MSRGILADTDARAELQAGTRSPTLQSAGGAPTEKRSPERTDASVPAAERDRLGLRFRVL